MANNLLTENPKIYIIGEPSISEEGLLDFFEQQFKDKNAEDYLCDLTPPDFKPGEVLCETGGRLCYMSFGKGRKTNREYIAHIIKSGHESVLEHCVFTFIVTGISRTLSHEWVRHRIGMSYSQVSQRYVDSKDINFVVPPLLIGDTESEKILEEVKDYIMTKYEELSKRSEKILFDRFPDMSKTDFRKNSRQVARTVLPGMSETAIQITANCRSIRHFLDLRASAGADLEIRRLAIVLYRALNEKTPNLFQDYEIINLADGTEALKRSI